MKQAKGLLRYKAS